MAGFDVGVKPIGAFPFIGPFFAERLTLTKLTWLAIAFAGMVLIVEAAPDAGDVGTNYFAGILMALGAFILVQGIVEIIRCVICLRQGEWPSREEDVQEVDVDKLKDMVHVKDEDIAGLDKFVVRQDGAHK